MNKTTAVRVATMVLLAYAGVAGAQAPKQTNVMVNEPTTKGGQRLLWIDQEPIIVRGKDVTITWKITTKGYEFPKDGIVFQDPSQFIKCAGKGTTFTCVDTNTAPGRFKYTIKVERSGSKDHPQPLDPWVVNDM